MSTVIPQRDLRNYNAQIVERVAAGESFVITRDGVPVADVTPHRVDLRRPRFPRTDSLTAFFGTHAALDVTSWVDDIHATDDFVDDDPFTSAGTH